MVGEWEMTYEVSRARKYISTAHNDLMFSKKANETGEILKGRKGISDVLS